MTDVTKAMCKGALLTAGGVLLLALLYVGSILWARAYNGEAAFECLQNPQCRAQLWSSGPASVAVPPAPAPAPTPTPTPPPKKGK